MQITNRSKNTESILKFQVCKQVDTKARQTNIWPSDTQDGEGVVWIGVQGKNNESSEEIPELLKCDKEDALVSYFGIMSAIR